MATLNLPQGFVNTSAMSAKELSEYNQNRYTKKQPQQKPISKPAAPAAPAAPAPAFKLLELNLGAPPLKINWGKKKTPPAASAVSLTQTPAPAAPTSLPPAPPAAPPAPHTASLPFPQPISMPVPSHPPAAMSVPSAPVSFPQPMPQPAPSADDDFDEDEDEETQSPLFAPPASAPLPAAALPFAQAMLHPAAPPAFQNAQQQAQMALIKQLHEKGQSDDDIRKLLADLNNQATHNDTINVISQILHG